MNSGLVRLHGRYAPEPPDTRFDRYVERSAGCWIWRGAVQSSGYGTFWSGSRRVLAHRFAYEREYGSIPAGLTIDHLCRTPLCVRPKHLEPVPIAVNLARGNGVSARNARKTACPKGHRYTAVKRGRRICHPCIAERCRRARAALTKSKEIAA